MSATVGWQPASQRVRSFGPETVTWNTRPAAVPSFDQAAFHEEIYPLGVVLEPKWELAELAAKLRHQAKEPVVFKLQRAIVIRGKR